ncbi:MAG: HDOD domain-containing protein [Spirochaeta sp.]|nr:HDOD domain-containing protein [Spirochaeta sp.]
MAKKVDTEKILQAARSGIPITVKTYTLPHETEMQLEEVLAVFLKEMGQEKLRDPLAYCLREIAVNAKKANTKRVYFKDKGLNMNSDTDYQAGMDKFKQETLDDIDYYLKKQKEAGLYIKITFHARGNELVVSVANNSEINKKEQIRVYDRIARSRAFDSLEEALTTVLDDSEGAGLGIVILVLMLKKIGLDEDAFDIDTREGETVAELTIPITNLQKAISDPDSELQEIARQISTDPSLTADLLKVVNSAQFMLPKRVDNIVEAVKLVGLRGLRNLLYSYGTQKILGVDTPETKELWEHSYRAAFYAYNLTKNITRKKQLLDDVYVGGILHDMGKIIFSSVHPEVHGKMETFCRDKGLSIELFEDLANGVNHAEIGGIVAENWNFPDALVNAIKYHHHPTDAPEEFQEVALAVYMANTLCHYKENRLSFDQVFDEALREFRMQNEEDLLKVETRLAEAFDRDARV